MVDIIPRHEWCPIPPAGNPRPIPLPAPRLWLHHGATGGHSIQTAIAYARYHIFERGWNDIGYSFLIAEGKILEGRGAGRQGAHTKGDNSESHGICMVGNYSTDLPTDSDLDALRALLSHGAEQGWWPTARLTGGHRDAPGARTTCPGTALHKIIPTINTDGVEEPAVATVIATDRRLTVEPRTWTPIPMRRFLGGDQTAHDGEYVTGREGPHDYKTYVRFGSEFGRQAIVRFVRDVGGEHDFTGSQDWVQTPGKDFVAHTWWFSPRVGKPTGVEVWHDSDGPLEVEYAQLGVKAG